MAPDRFYHYSFLNGTLIGSEHPDSARRPRAVVEHFIRERGVRTLLTLRPACRSLETAELRHCRLPMKGMPTRREAEAAVAVIRDNLPRGAVWVHCQQGIDRTGCVIGCYRVSAGEGAEAVIEDLYRVFPERRRQPRAMELWEPYAEMIRSFAGGS